MRLREFGANRVRNRGGEMIEKHQGGAQQHFKRISALAGARGGGRTRLNVCSASLRGFKCACRSVRGKALGSGGAAFLR